MQPEASDLLGTWFMSNVGVIPDEDGILVFRPDGICIQFPSAVTRPHIGQTFRLWYSLPDRDTIEYKMKPDGRKWLRFVERNETGWTMICDEELSNVRHYKKFPCRRAMPEELPEWFDEMMEKNLAKMALLLNTESTAEPADPGDDPEDAHQPQPEVEGRDRKRFARPRRSLMKTIATIAMFVLALAGCSRNQDPTPRSPLFDESVYQELKSGLGVELPEDYLEYMRAYNGEPPEPNTFWVVPGKWGSGVNDWFVMARGEEHRSMLGVLAWDGLPLKPGLIPIGGDGSFGYILMSIRPEDHGSIHYCCTWSNDGKTDIFGSMGFWKIADSFSGFLDKLGEMPESK